MTLRSDFPLIVKIFVSAVAGARSAHERTTRSDASVEFSVLSTQTRI
jgi:hypothetical protein